METKETAQQIRMRRYESKKNSTPATYKLQQEEYFKSVGRYKDDKEGRNKRYESDITYIQTIPSADVPKELVDDVAMIIEHHNSDKKNSTRFKVKAIKIVYTFKQQQKAHDDALHKMLSSIG